MESCSWCVDGSAISVYLNGLLIGSTVVPLGNIVPSNNEFNIARDPSNPTRRFIGLIDEVEIHDRALSTTEIQSIFDAGSAGKCKEEDSDGDGIADDEDACPDSNTEATVSIEDCDSGVDNPVFSDGCTLADLIDEIVDDCVDGARNHGQFVRCFARSTNALKRDGLITGDEKEALQSCAAQSSLP
ncbi:MAG: hypothetical protein ETSY1_18520 [Candidatus Entotheonella factor]|uniref:LamG-like jellyroll fold domain-containing protein n=1 Tax=Entotheonella factor TaxID=1429438 RepID=W4LK67_ENTF1|nr:MAG: hypothetical protein ETSY1_18520 [Candidatus Entotheonella factor]